MGLHTLPCELHTHPPLTHPPLLENPALCVSRAEEQGSSEPQ